MSLVPTLREQVKAHPEKIAVSEGEYSLTYADLELQSDRIAAGLAVLLQSDDDVVACIKTSMVTTMLFGFAGLKSGRGFLILDVRDSSERLRQICATARVRHIVVDTEEAEALAIKLGCRVHALSDWTDTEATTAPPDPKPDALCYIEPTSGSTGLPKLVPITHATLAHYAELQRQLGEIGPTDTVGLLGEMWFDTLFAGLIAGATLTAYDLRGRGSAALPDWMREQQVTVIQTFVAAFRAMCVAADAPLAHLRLVKLSGEVVLHSDVEHFERLCSSDAQLINYYGSTECSLMAANRHHPGAPVPETGLPVGFPVDGSEILLLDETGSEVSPGAVGRMVVRAKHMSPGYLNAPEKSQGVYTTTDDGRRSLDTGDLARFDPDVGLTVVGRVDDQVKIRGYSVRYSEVEDALLSRADITTGAVTSILAPGGIRQLVAHYIPVEWPGPETDDLRRDMLERLPAYMVPRYFLAHRSLPRTETGKVLRRALPNPLETKNQEKPAGADFVGDLEHALAEIWRGILGHDQFGREDDFFDLGGDSLQAMTMVLTVERQFPVHVGYETLIVRGGSIAALAQRIELARSDRPSPPVNLLRRGDDSPPLYILPVGNGEFSNWLPIMDALPTTRALVGVHVRDLQKDPPFPAVAVQDLAEGAVERLLQHDPNGPYLLAGYSMGAQVALETAHLLEAAGRPVTGVLLIDPLVVAQAPGFKRWRRLWVRQAMAEPAPWSTLWDRIAHMYLSRPSRDAETADEAATWRYRPSTLSNVPVILARAIENAPDPEGYLRFWRGRLGKDVTVWDLDGPHHLLMKPPHAAALAQRIHVWLQSLQDRASEISEKP